jgi:hypothetical protein
MRLLRRIWPDMIRLHRGSADKLSDLLGDDHDFAVFRQTLLDDAGKFVSETDVHALLGLIDRRRAELHAAARPLGERLFAEKPKCLAARFQCYWKTWKTSAEIEPQLEEQLITGG